MKLTKNVLPMLYMSGIVAGATTIIALSDVPKPICSVERDNLGNPINVIGKVSLNKTARMTALLSALAMIGGFGTLAVKSLKGEDLEDVATGDKILSPTTQSIIDLGNTSQTEMEYVPAGIAPQQTMSINLTKSANAPATGKPRDIIKEIANSHQSTVIVAEPGCGKSTLEKAVLATLLQSFENKDIYIAGKKNDSWFGLSANTSRFCFVNKDTLSDFVTMMETVQNELIKRLGTPENERDFEKQPLVLLLDDWHALITSLDEPSKKKVVQILGEILTTGREVFVVVHVITQSFNVKSLGLDDANIRGSMNLIALMKSNTDDSGRNDGGVGTARRMINNPSIIGDDQRQEMLNQLPKFIKETERTGIPAMVCIMGVNPTIEMLPNLNWVRDFKVNVVDETETIDESIEDSEPLTNTVNDNFDLDTAVATLNKTLSLDVETQDTTLEKLSDKELHIKCQRYANQGYSLYAIITKVFLKPNKGRAFTDAQKRIQDTESQFGKIDFPNKNNNN